MRRPLPPSRAGVWFLLAIASILVLAARHDRSATPTAAKGSPVAAAPETEAARAVVPSLVASAAPAKAPSTTARVAPRSAGPATHGLVLRPLAESDEPADAALDKAAPSPALTIEEQQAMARREAEGLVTIRNADGSETLNHEGRFTDHTVVRVGPDGKPFYECITGADLARIATSKNRPAAPPAMEDR